MDKKRCMTCGQIGHDSNACPKREWRAGGKWCTHCQKNDHDDSECWSTRTIRSTLYGIGTGYGPTWWEAIGNPIPPQKEMPPAVATAVAKSLWELYSR